MKTKAKCEREAAWAELQLPASLLSGLVFISVPCLRPSSRSCNLGSIHNWLRPKAALGLSRLSWFLSFQTDEG